MGTTIGIILYPDNEELEWARPFEAFGMAGMGRDVEVLTIAETIEPVRGAKGLRVLPDHTFETAPALDVVLVPGGQGSRAQMRNPVLLDWLHNGKLVTSAGVSAGIDMSLWLVGQLFGVEHARATQRWMEYDPAPPYTADV